MSNKIIHWIAAGLFYTIPAVLMTHSTALDITLGTVLNAVYLWASQKLTPTVSVSTAPTTQASQ